MLSEKGKSENNAVAKIDPAYPKTLKNQIFQISYRQFPR